MADKRSSAHHLTAAVACGNILGTQPLSAHRVCLQAILTLATSFPRRDTWSA